LGFAPVEGREVVAAFDGGAITCDAGLRSSANVCSQLRVGYEDLNEADYQNRAPAREHGSPSSELLVSAERIV
jgi:hypothetical protein